MPILGMNKFSSFEPFKSKYPPMISQNTPFISSFRRGFPPRFRREGRKPQLSRVCFILRSLLRRFWNHTCKGKDFSISAFDFLNYSNKKKLKQVEKADNKLKGSS